MQHPRSARVALSLLALLSLLLFSTSSSQQQGPVLYVNNADPTCNGRSPCYTTIQAAVDAALPGDTIQIQAGSYAEKVTISGKNNTATVTESDRIIIEADPLSPPGSVVITGASQVCTNGYAFRLQQSKFITMRGLTITGTGGQAISLMGGNNQNQAIHIEQNRIFDNGSSECNGGITIARGNPDTLIVNNLIYANGRNGITFIDADGGPHYIIENTIHTNQWSGVRVARSHEVFLVNNVITQNGTAAGSTGGRFGISREASTAPQPQGIHLLNNLICGNRLGEIDGPALDGTDSENLTPGGLQGAGVSASPGCEIPANVYANLNGTDGLPNTADDDFRLAAGSPAIDGGMDPRTLGLNILFNATFESDFSTEAIRPSDGNADRLLAFDMGAFEFPNNPPTANAGADQTTFRGVLVTLDGTQSHDADGAPLTFQWTVISQPAGSAVSLDNPTSNRPLFTPPLLGAYVFQLVVNDGEFNSAPALVRVTAVNRNPTANASGPYSGRARDPIQFTGSGSDLDGDPVTFTWDFGDGGTASGPVPTHAYASAGTFTVTMTVADPFGGFATSQTAATVTTAGPEITAFSPGSGTLGTEVTIQGKSFDPTPGSSVVRFNGVRALITGIAQTTIKTFVPLGATTGRITVETPQGIGTSSEDFIAQLRQDFALSVSPGVGIAVQGTSTSYAVQVLSTGIEPFTGLAALTVTGLPPGVTAAFMPSTLGSSTPGILTLTTTSSTPVGSNAVEVRATTHIEGHTVTRAATITLGVQAPGQTVLAGEVRDENDRPLAGVSIKQGGTTITDLGVTDAGGNFFIPLSVMGQQIFLVDGSTANTPTATYSTIPVTLDIQPGVVNTLGFTPRLHAQPVVKLTPITPGQAVVLTDPEIPGFKMTIPTGVQIIGWDGKPNTQFSVTAVPIDRSPLPPPPAGQSSRQIYLFNFGKMGGGIPTGNIPIDTPNDVDGLPGEKVDLYYFNEAPDGTAPNQWEKYGTGTVSSDGTRIVTDINPATGLPYGIPRFCCGASSTWTRQISFFLEFSL
ncbi:MAG: PKD domain-containing protein [Deltaproteobacteria bacterium]|nr:PKD domain-containing protein [Deltaproteobacteria bacterium]